MLPESRGKTYIIRIASIYIDLFRHKYGFVPQISYGRFGRSLKKLMKTHTELQISALLIVFFEWKGMDGNSFFESQKLLNANHNPQWFFSTINTYEAYLRNVFGLNMDNEDDVRKFVANYMLSTVRNLQ